MAQIDFFFNDTESRRRKREGIDKASRNQHYLLNKAREIAKEIALAKGQTNSDEVSQELLARGYPDCIGPAAGAIFKTKEWVWTGRFINSTRVTNHSRLIRVWALRG